MTMTPKISQPSPKKLGLEHAFIMFEGIEKTSMELKMILLCALFDWKEAFHSPISSLLLAFIDICSFY
jgi:hypothetical protein